MDNYDVIKKLLGLISPVGETNTDNERYENLKATYTLIEKLIQDIYDVMSYSVYQEYSRKRAGESAEKFMVALKQEFFMKLKEEGCDFCNKPNVEHSSSTYCKICGRNLNF